MRRVGIALLVGVLLTATVEAGAAEGQEPPAHLTVSATGTGAQGEAMGIACALNFVSVPSNRVVGQCQITVGGDEVTVGGLPVDGQRALTVALNRALTVRGAAEAGTGRFAPLVQHGSAGFPVYVHIDPLGRGWSLTADLPGGGTPTVARGILAQGTIALGMP